MALLALSYAILFPSHLRSEAFGISLLEGAMFGKPLISSEIGTGTTYINIDGKTGVVVPPSDQMLYARQWIIYGIIKKSPQIWANARKKDIMDLFKKIK